MTAPKVIIKFEPSATVVAPVRQWSALHSHVDGLVSAGEDDAARHEIDLDRVVRGPIGKVWFLTARIWRASKRLKPCSVAPVDCVRIDRDSRDTVPSVSASRPSFVLPAPLSASCGSVPATVTWKGWLLLTPTSLSVAERWLSRCWMSIRVRQGITPVAACRVVEVMPSPQFTFTLQLPSWATS